MTSSQSAGVGRAIAITALVAGTLDIATALTKYFLTTGRTPLNVLRYVASGVWGQAALVGSWEMAAAGLALHYTVALLFTGLFFWLYPRWRALWGSPILVGIAYGALVWLVMNGVVVPASQVAPAPFRPSHAAVELLIIIVCVGLPIGFGARRFYQSQMAQSKD